MKRIEIGTRLPDVTGAAHDGETEQAALRRVATLVARESSPAEVFAAVTEEVGHVLRVDAISLIRYEPDATATVVATWGGLAPVTASIYDQPSIAQQYPFHAILKLQLQNYGIRPKTPAYADVSLAIQKALSPTP